MYGITECVIYKMQYYTRVILPYLTTFKVLFKIFLINELTRNWF